MQPKIQQELFASAAVWPSLIRGHREPSQKARVGGMVDVGMSAGGVKEGVESLTWRGYANHPFQSVPLPLQGVVVWCTGHRCDCVVYLKLSPMFGNAGGNAGSSGQASARWELLENVSMRAGTLAAIKFRHLMPALPAPLCCPCCDTPSLSSVCVILRAAPYYYFSSQKFLLERVFLKELWWLMQSSSLFRAISSSPMTSPVCSLGRFVSSISLAQTLGHGPAVSHLHWVLGFTWVFIGCLEPLALKSGTRAAGIWEAFQETAQGSLRRCDSWDQTSFGNEVNRGFRYSAKSWCRYPWSVSWCSISDNDCSLLNSRDQARPWAGWVSSVHAGFSPAACRRDSGSDWGFRLYL